jgi:uncharacterized coiled-coil DUF342 family protein
MINLKKRKTKHTNFVRDHIHYMHRSLVEKSKNLDELKGKELNAKVKEIQSISKRMKQYRKYLNLILL